MTICGKHTPMRGFITKVTLVVMLVMAAWPVFGQVTDSLAVGDSLQILGLDDAQAKKDSLARVIPIRTIAIDPQAMMAGNVYRQNVRFDAQAVLEPDLLYRLDGFYNTLGQIGKPYRRNLMGLDPTFFRDESLYVNPFTGAEDVYVINSETSMPFYDTRTPYINAYYGQGKADLSQLRVDVSQNITPFWNVTALYYRRNAGGVYKEFETSHNNLALTSNIRTKMDRYHAFISGYFHEGQDKLNGGVRQGIAFEELFNKSLQPVALSAASYRKYLRNARFMHVYNLVNRSEFAADTMAIDSAPPGSEKPFPHMVRLFNSFSVEGYEQDFVDRGLDISVNQYQFPVYPTLGDSSFFWERYTHTRYKGDIGLLYKYTAADFNMGHKFALKADRATFEKNFLNTDYNRLVTEWVGSVRFNAKPFALSGEARTINTVSNLFEPEPFAEVTGAISLPKTIDAYSYKVPGPFAREKDSVLVSRTYRPVTISIKSIMASRNPTLQQAFGTGYYGNNFVSDATLRNSQYRHVRVGVRYQGRPQWRREAEIPPTEIEVNGFLSRVGSIIYYDTAMVVRQSTAGFYLQYLGADAKFRVRLGSFFIENHTVYQVPMSNVGLDSTLGRMQPNLYGKASVYFDTRKIKVATSLRLGLDYYYSLAYNSPLFDPASQQFYPQTQFTQEGYHRLDAYFGAHVKKAYVFLKLVHANEGLFTPGYFSTTLYPMMDLTFMVGVNWTFFD